MNWTIRPKRHGRLTFVLLSLFLVSDLNTQAKAEEKSRLQRLSELPGLQQHWGPWVEFRKLYDEGRYESALSELQSKPKPAEPLYFYNLGAAHFKLDNLGTALAYFSKANYMLPYHPEIRFNLNLTQDLLRKKLGLQNLDAGSDWIELAGDQIPQRLMGSVWGLALFFLFAVALRNYVKLRDTKKALMHGSTWVAGVALLITLFIYGAKTYADWNPPAFTLKNATLRSGPGEHLLDLGLLRAGMKVRLTGRQLKDKGEELWTQVRFGEEKHGWVPSQTLLALE